MKRIIFLLAALFSVGFSEDIVQSAKNAHINQDHNMAAELYQKACDGGDNFSCIQLGSLYEGGKGVEQDYKKAAELLKKGCSAGDGFGCYNLGGLHIGGKGIKQNFSIAKQYYIQACDLGFKFGCDKYKELNE